MKEKEITVDRRDLGHALGTENIESLQMIPGDTVLVLREVEDLPPLGVEHQVLADKEVVLLLAKLHLPSSS